MMNKLGRIVRLVKALDSYDIRLKPKQILTLSTDIDKTTLHNSKYKASALMDLSEYKATLPSNEYVRLLHCINHYQDSISLNYHRHNK